MTEAPPLGTRVDEPGTLIAGIVVGLLSMVSAVRADRMFFVEEYTYPGPLLLGIFASILGLSAIFLGRSMRAKARAISIVLGILGIILSAPVVAACGYMALVFGLGGSR